MRLAKVVIAAEGLAIDTIVASPRSVAKPWKCPTIRDVPACFAYAPPHGSRSVSSADRGGTGGQAFEPPADIALMACPVSLAAFWTCIRVVPLATVPANWLLPVPKTP